MPSPPEADPRILFQSLRHSLEGLKVCMRSERAFRQEMALSIIFLPLGLWIGETAVEKILLTGSILFVFIMELVNTAIERAVDRISTDRHELSKEAKDMGSAAVFFSLLMVVLTWGLIIFL